MRNHRVLLLALAAGLVATALLAAAQPNAHRPGGADGHAPSAAEGKWANLSEDVRGRGLAAAESHHLFAKLTYDNGTATGRFVSFGLDNSTGVLTNLSVRRANGSTTYFASVTPSPAIAGDVRVTGSLLRLEGDNATVRVHNNPIALTQWTADGAGLNLTFAVANGTTVVTDPVVNHTLRLINGGQHAHLTLVGNGTFVSFDNATIQVALEDGARLLFAYHTPESRLMADALHATLNATSKGHVGAIVNVVGADGNDTLDDATDLGVATATERSGRNLTVHVSSDDAAGKAILLNVDNDTLPANASIVVTLDNETLPNGTMADALNATGATVNVTRGDDGVTIAVSVPHFSDHAISIQSVDTNATTPTTTTTSTVTPTATTTETTTSGTTPTSSSPPAKGTPGFEAIVAIAAVGAALLILRRRS